jgi:5,5'-dehydrodivanillate O-demethylase
MLSADKNQLLTEIEPGQPMGDLLRRYWQPIAGESEFDDKPIKPMRLFGENLVLYKDRSGNFGLVDRHCTHRRADLSYGWVEDCGIRCSYHGWLFDAAGRCTEQPFDDIANPGTRLKERCAIKAYPVRALAGLLWAYMGPDPAPELPVWAPFTWGNGFAEVAGCNIPCNWLQCQENSIDPVHFEWMHDTWPSRMKGNYVPRAPKHLKLNFTEFDYGFQYKRVREGMTEDDVMWTVGRVALWPNGFYLGGHFEWRVPVDNENSLCICWFFSRVPTESEPYVQKRVPTWYAPIKGEDGRWITSHVINQDVVGWVGQGKIADRTREKLGMSDVGITKMRQRMFADLDAIAHGRDPSGIIRDADQAKCVELPIASPEIHRDGMPLEKMKAHPVLNGRLNGNRWLAGQPDEVYNDFMDAMGWPERKRPTSLKAAE